MLQKNFYTHQGMYGIWKTPNKNQGRCHKNARKIVHSVIKWKALSTGNCYDSCENQGIPHTVETQLKLNYMESILYVTGKSWTTITNEGMKNWHVTTCSSDVYSLFSLSMLLIDHK